MSQPLRYKPDSGHRYWCYSPEGDGFTFWKTAEERDAYAAKEIRTYLDDDEWFEEVQNVIGGVVTHIAQAVDIKKPKGNLDEYGYDENGDGPWLDPGDTSCNYVLSLLEVES